MSNDELAERHIVLHDLVTKRCKPNALWNTSHYLSQNQECIKSWNQITICARWIFQDKTDNGTCGQTQDLKQDDLRDDFCNAPKFA